jgi:exopolysaccharide biosynthesis polyprenyl glycosylphosphotransferase
MAAQPRTIELAVQSRSSSARLRAVALAPPRLPLAALVPSMDAIMLVTATMLFARSDVSGIVYAAVAFFVLAVSGSQQARINPRLSDDVFPLIGWLAFPLLAAAPFADSSLEVAGFVRVVPVAVLMVLAGRAVCYWLIRRARAKGLVIEPTLIVGAGSLGVRMARNLRDHPEFGLVPVGFLDSFEDVDLPEPILGDASDLESVVRAYGVTKIIVAFGAIREPEMVPILRTCDRLPVEIYVMPRFFELGVAPDGRSTEDLWGIPLRHLRRSALRTAAWRIKRGFDIVVSALLLIASSPVLVGAAFATRMSGPGPVFFRQKRVGQRGEVFQLLKFRTMSPDPDSDTLWSKSEDERRTRVGRLLRRTSLDELPQLINVLRGEMSLVGPRPERPYFVDQFRVTVQAYDARHRVPAGLTGWAQVHGLRGDTSIQDRAVFDNSYVEHWSLWRDIVIMLRTVGAVVSGAGS